MLAFESSLLMEIHTLEDSLGYYDAALNCHASKAIGDTMGKVKDLLEAMGNKARKHLRSQHSTLGGGDLKSNVVRGGIHAV